jgi:starch synthase (maltosyl-transferring)
VVPSRLEIVAVERVTPVVDDGRFAAKRLAGDEIVVEADVFAHGHELVAGAVRYRHRGEEAWREIELELLDNDRYTASFPATTVGFYEFQVTAWPDEVGTWRSAVGRKAAAGQDVSSDLEVGARLAEVAAKRATGKSRKALRDFAATLRESTAPKAKTLDALAALARRVPDPDAIVASPVYPVLAERPLAGCSAWYEMFPRSASPDPERPGTLRDVIARLPYVAELGFDVLYLPPIHPIGERNRKGLNNAPTAKRGDPGSPWAIGAAAGGHTAIDPGLGDLDDFAALVRTAKKHRIEIALDLALQCAPDHPWVTEHPEWFRHRPDGTIAYAENPPKRYEDIVPLDFESEAWPELWQAVLDVVLTWVDRGVKIFRVDNPHTKPFALWEWLLGAVRDRHPDVLFLAEAFTRPKVMHRLAKLGFSQSYTYFTWRETAHELRTYFEELAHGPGADYFRPNAWPNTPDILPEHLQKGGKPEFATRLLLAALLSASYGIYGPAFELGLAAPREAGSEEYLDSEKYEIHHWDLERPGSLRHLIARVNEIRREHPALWRNDSLHFHSVDDEHLLAWSKRSEDGADVVLTIVNLDPHRTRSGWTWLDLGEIGVVGDEPFVVTDLLTGASFEWQGNVNYVELNPSHTAAHVLSVQPTVSGA